MLKIVKGGLFFPVFLVGMGAAVSVEAATYGQRAVAAVLMGEAWGEGRVGMTAVAEVIRNRADRWGISPLAVIKKPRHFACLNHTTPEALIRKFQGKEDFEIALRIARTVYNEPERLPGFTTGATHFDNVEATPYWAKGRAPIAIIGNLAFYKLAL